jgi:branched-chain amino acid transport system ATP-binding protein
MPEPVLAVDGLAVAYGPIRAVRGCSFEVGEGETVAIVGANGAGKTTILRALSNLVARQAGEVRLRGGSTAGLAPHALARLGLAQVPEWRGVLGRMSVLENLRVAYDVRPARAPFAAALEAVFARFPRLQERAAQRAGSMSGGEQQMLALARAIVNPPAVLLVDEPSLGLAPIMIRAAFRALAEFRRAGTAVLLVEQNVRSALALADRAYVLRLGEFVLAGPGTALLAREDELRHHLVTQAPPRGAPAARAPGDSLARA